ncbi:MAG: LapA family protein [Fidelibacterota bacterium]
MKLVKIFGLLLLLILILVFLLQNTEQVTVDLIFRKFEHISVAFVMIGALTAGILIGYGVVVAQVFSAKAENRALRLKNKRISDELNDLRNVAIDEGIYDHEDGDA